MNRDVVGRRRLQRAMCAIWLAVAAGILAWAAPAAAQPLQTVVVTVNHYDGKVMEIELRSGKLDYLELRGVKIVDEACREAAADRVSDLTAGRVQYLEIHSPQRNAQNRLSGYVWSESVMLNLLLLSEGLADLSDDDSRYADTFWAARNSAQRRHVGMWSGAGDCLG